jgi:WD40 repeat protein/energy-coupling factor transporter ATP-binding protein EcfA2
VARVFVSFATPDLPVAEEVADWLLRDGHDVFLDRDAVSGIRAGEQWRQRLYNELRRDDAVISIVTPASIASVWCAAEVGIADALGCLLIPLLATGDARHPLLDHRQYADYGADPKAARARVLDALRHLDGGSSTERWPDGTNPFPGLEPFAPSSAPVYFGRTVEVRELAQRLRIPRGRDGGIVVIVGPSGCGKSSLLNAGLLPLVDQDADWVTTLPWRPGDDPVAALARALTRTAHRVGLSWSTEEVRRSLAASADGLRRLADDLLDAPSAARADRLLIAADQGEELFTPTDPTARRHLADLFSRAVRGPVQPVISLRSEFLDDLRDLPGFAGVPMDVFVLPPFSPTALPLVIEGPARVAGLRLEPELVSRLVDHTGSGDALPLLAFTLQKLSDGLGRGDTLTLSRYSTLGGVQGALTGHADAALAKAVETTGLTEREVLAALLRLVAIDDAGRWSRRQVDVEELPTQTRAALQVLVDQRLLVVDSHAGAETVAVVHEALLTAWSPLRNAIDDQLVALQAARTVEQAATEWQRDRRPDDYLWGPKRVAGALANLGSPAEAETTGAATMPHRFAVHLDERARQFLEASVAQVRTTQRRAARLRRRATVVLSTLLVMAVAAGAVAVWQSGEAREGQRLAVARQLLARSEGIQPTDPFTALLLGEAAHRIHPDPTTDAGLVNAVRNTRFSTALEGHQSLVWSATYSPDGQTIATASADGTLRLWDTSTPSRPQPWGVPLGGLINPRSVAFSPDGNILAATSGDSVTLFDVTDPRIPRPLGPDLTGHTRFVWSVAFSPDGRTLASGSADSTIILWDVTNPDQIHRRGQPLVGHFGDVNSVAFAPDGRTLVSGSHDMTARLWHLDDPAAPSRLSDLLAEHTGIVWSARFSPDGRAVATASSDGTTLLWDVTDRTAPRRMGPPLTEHSEPVLALAFAPDGRTLATASGDQTVLLWDVSDPSGAHRLKDRLEGHTDSILSVAFSPDGRRLVTGSWDNKALIWVVDDPRRPQRLGGPLIGHTDAVSALAFSPDGSTLATAGRDQSVQLWDVSDPERSHPAGNPLLGHQGGVTSLAFTPDGRTLVTAGTDGALLVWDVSDRVAAHRIGQARTDGPDPVWSIAVTPDGATLVSAGDSGTVTTWDITDPTRPRRLGDPLQAHAAGIFATAVSPDGRMLATGSTDNTVRLWDITDPGHPRSLGRPLGGHNLWISSLAFAPQGHVLASASWDRTVLLWDTTDPASPRRLGQPLAGYGSTVHAVTFDRSGTTLATASADLSVLLWDTADPAQARHLGDRLTGHSQPVLALAFKPNGPVLATASADHSVHLWSLPGLDVGASAAMAQACSITGRGLDPAEWSIYALGLPYEESCPA